MSRRPYTPPDTGGMQSKSRKADKPVATPDPALQPIIILVRPQLPENIGMTARAMLNCGLSQLRIVAPKCEWPHQNAFNASSGADHVLRDATAFDSIESATADLQIIYATSPRNHFVNVPVVDLQEAAEEIVSALANQFPSLGEGQRAVGERGGLSGQSRQITPPQSRDATLTLPQGEGSIKIGILFGPERAGLENEDIAKANKILTIPLQRDFNSLNLSQAVLLVGYQLFLQMAQHDLSVVSLRGQGTRADPAAPRAELDEFMNRLIGLMDDGGFLHPPEKRPTMVDNLRAMFMRMGLSTQEIKTLHGVVTTLLKKKD